MPHRSLSLLILALCCLGRLMAQQTAAPPPLPVPPAPVTSIAPPLPGQLKAELAPAPSRIPDLPPPAATVVPSTSLNKSPVVSSTSSSGQFIVHGNDLSLRSAFSSRCDEIGEELRLLLRDQKPWALPIVVLLNSGEAAKKSDKPVLMTVSKVTHGGFHLQVTVNLRPDLRPTEVRAEMVRALLAERILRDQKELVAQRPLLLPDWLYTGVLEAMDYRKRARPSALFAAIFKSGKIFGIEEIIEASPVEMDALSKTIYQTSCCALVLALIDQPEAGVRLGRFLASLGSDPRPERELLNQAFPNFAASPASLNKWWSLQLASLSRPSVAEPMTAADTLKVLEDALTFRYQAKASEIPKPRPVVARVETVSLEKVRNPTVAAAPSPVQPETAAVDTPPEETEKRGFLSWLNPFGKKKESHDDVIEAAIEEAAQVEAESVKGEEQTMPEALPVGPQIAEAPPVAAGSKTVFPKDRKPILNRWFGPEEKETPVAAAPAPTEPTAVAPAPAVSAPTETPVVEKPAPAPRKPSRLNPFNWFRKDKAGDSPSSDEPPSAPTPEAPAPSAPKAAESEEKPATTVMSDWLDGKSPFIALAYQQVAVEAPAEPPPPQAEPVKEKKRLFGLFGNKKKAEAVPAEPAPEPTETKPAAPNMEKPAEAAKPAKTEAKPAPAAKVETQPEAKAPPVSPPVSAPEPATMAKEAPPATAVPESLADVPVAMPAEPVATTTKPKREPLRLRSLFGSGKKKEETPKPEEVIAPPAMPATEAPMTAMPDAKPAANDSPLPPPAPAMPAVTAVTVPPAVPEPAPATKKPTVKKAEPAKPKNEPVIAAAIPIEDYAAIMKRSDRKQILQRNLIALQALQQRGAILFRPIIADYTALVVELMDGKTKDVPARLQALRARSDKAMARSKAVRDALDVHEANASPAMSGTFDDYLKLPETIRRELPERKDAISKYLDALDREFSKQ